MSEKLQNNIASSASDTVTVSSLTELEFVLSNVTGGETILLEAGSYGDLSLSDLNFDTEVTIRSASDANLAEFSTIELISSSNLVFDRVEVDFTPNEETVSWDSAVRIVSSSEITFSNAIVTGGPAVNGIAPETEAGGQDETGNVLGLPAGRGMTITTSSNITIESSDISQFQNAIVANQIDGLNVLNNELHDLRATPIRGGDVDDVLLEGNHFYNFQPWQFGGAGDHGDLVHFWTRPTSQDAPSENITITNNFFEQGEGEALLGIYLDDNKTGIGFDNVTITDNVLYNGNRQGIRIENGNDVLIESNTLLQSSGDKSDGPSVVLEDGTKNVTIKDNILSHEMAFDETINPNSIVMQNNLEVQNHDSGADNFVGDLFVNPFVGESAELVDLQALPNGLVSEMGVGAPLTAFGSINADGIKAFVASEAGAGLQLLQHSFQLSGLFDANEASQLANSTITWDFGDGVTSTGVDAVHTFSHAGLYDVTATVTLSNGQTLSFSKSVKAETPIALHANFDEGISDLSDHTQGVNVAGDVSLENNGDGYAVKLNGGSVSFDDSSQFHNNDEYTVFVDFKKEAGAEDGGGRLVHFSKSFVVNVHDDSLSVAVTTDQGTNWIRTDDIGLDDAEWHSLGLTFSSKEGVAILYLDGVEVGRLEGLAGALQVGLTGQSMHLGHPWGESFPGLVDNFAFLRGVVAAEDISKGTLVFAELASDNPDGTPAEEPAGPPSDTGSEDPTDQPTNTGSDEPNDPATDTPPTDEDAPTPPVTLPNNSISGSQGNDRLFGTSGADEIDGVGGKDQIYAGEGDDIIHLGDADWGRAHGEAGDDTLLGGAANDVLYGGSGNDFLDGGGGSDKLFGGIGNDYLTSGTGLNKLYGEEGDDVLRVTAGENNTLDGGDGNDELYGANAHDKLYGGSGDDVLFGAGGNDRLSGGDGADEFIFSSDSGRDKVIDFNTEVDSLTLKDLSFQSRDEVIKNMFEKNGDSILILDEAGSDFSWSTSNYVRFVDVTLENLVQTDIDIVF